MPVTLTLRTVKGTALTNAEMDANFTNIKAAVEAAEAAIAALPETTDVTNAINSAVSVSSLRATLDPVYVEQGGDTMTGPLVLSGAPTIDLHAATKKYVDDADALKAPLASPSLSGTPTAPTATAGTNNTQLATTAFVQNTVSGVLSGTGVGSYVIATPPSNGTYAYGSTIAGSSLTVHGMFWSGGSDSYIQSGGTTLSGTWRYQGYAFGTLGNSLWVRIS